jgi:hypothetical protein
VAFASFAHLVPADVNALRDVYVLDRSTAPITLASGGARSTVANGESWSPDISDDGRLVVFVSLAGTLADPPITAAESAPAGAPRRRSVPTADTSPSLRARI